MKGKKTFIFYSDWINMIQEMPDKDAGELLKHILDYVNDNNPKTDNLLVKMAFGHIKPMLKEDLEKWENIREKRKKAGRKGGKANAKQKKANAKQIEAVNVNVNVNENDNINVNNIIDRKNKFCLSLSLLCKELEIDLETEKEFADYWTEHSERAKKMRFEKEKSFNIKLRLNRWLKNQKKWKKEKSSAKKEKQDAYTIIQQVKNGTYESSN